MENLYENLKIINAYINMDTKISNFSRAMCFTNDKIPKMNSKDEYKNDY